MDEELQFKVAARSNKYLGEWASSKLGKNEEEKKNYIQEIIRSDLEEAGQEDVFRKIKKDFQAASISIEEKEIRDQMEKALLRAKEDFKKLFNLLHYFLLFNLLQFYSKISAKCLQNFWRKLSVVQINQKKFRNVWCSSSYYFGFYK